VKVILMKAFVLMIAFVAALLVIGGAAAIEDNDHTDVYLFLHSNGSDETYNMSTMGPGTPAQTGDERIYADSERDFVLNQSLKADLFVLGEDLTGGEYGFRADVEVICDGYGGETTAQLSVIDSNNMSVIAQRDRLSPFLEITLSRSRQVSSFG
jgi:hypothetical protein